jgi:ribosomal-protein-alanine N-acetyltransferase
VNDLPEVSIRPPRPGDAGAFVAAVARSGELHHPWVAPWPTAEAYAGWLDRIGARTPHQRMAGFLVLAGNDIAGYVNASEIVRGAFDNAYLGYAAFAPWAGRGVMRRGLALVVDRCFAAERDGGLALHRVEANIQPGNEPSKRLARSLGFRLEGLSPRYLRIDGAWRDHERYALTAEEWSSPADRPGAYSASSSGGIRKSSSG